MAMNDPSNYGLNTPALVLPPPTRSDRRSTVSCTIFSAYTAIEGGFATCIVLKHYGCAHPVAEPARVTMVDTRSSHVLDAFPTNVEDGWTKITISCATLYTVF